MHELNIESVNWGNPSQQNIVDLYYARMWAISETVAECIHNSDLPTKWFIDDIRTNFLRFTNLTRSRFDELIEEGAHILTSWGIPEVFVVRPEEGEFEDDDYVNARIFTKEDMAEEFANDSPSEDALILTIMQSECGVASDASRLVETAFLNIVQPGGKINAHEG